MLKGYNYYLRMERAMSQNTVASYCSDVEKYAVNIDPALHAEVLERYAALGLKPYGGFLNPEIVPVVKRVKVVDYKIEYCDNYLEQMLEYGKKYATL